MTLPRASLLLLLVLPGVGCTPALPLDSGGPEQSELQWFWGDLHSHSGWSFDGCEEPEQTCVHAGALPGEEWLQAAVDAQLDFAALTDHAEADSYEWGPDSLHAEGGFEDVWEGQRAVLQAAEGGPVLPILGFEWTNNAIEDDNTAAGSHRTILLEDLDACRSYRIGGRLFQDGEKAPEQGDRTFYQEQVPLVYTPAELWAGLADAAFAPGCQPVRWISFAHHPAYRVPQFTNWANEANAPLAEDVVEIYSEHGSSECQGPTTEGCDWQLNEDQIYSTKGAVQTALNLGYPLGFVGGTDGHDGHPGSLADGPSHIAQWNPGEAEPIQHFGPGGLTGALVQGELSRSSLFDAIDARRTMATSGPRPDLWAWAEGQSGRSYLPGEHIPRADLPATIHLELYGLDQAGTLTDDQVDGVWVDQLLASHSVYDTQQGSTFTGSWDPAPEGSWTYLRVRWARADGADPTGAGLVEERVWLSPWFTDPRGCQAAPASSGLLLLLPLLMVRRRRKRS